MPPSLPVKNLGIEESLVKRMENYRKLRMLIRRSVKAPTTVILKQADAENVKY